MVNMKTKTIGITAETYQVLDDVMTLENIRAAIDKDNRFEVTIAVPDPWDDISDQDVWESSLSTVISAEEDLTIISDKVLAYTPEEGLIVHVVVDATRHLASALTLPLNNVIAGSKIFEVLQRPLTTKELIALKNARDYISCVIAVPQNTFVYHNHEELMDIISSVITGSELMMDISYKVVAIQDNSDFLVQVDGDVSMILEADHGK